MKYLFPKHIAVVPVDVLFRHLDKPFTLMQRARIVEPITERQKDKVAEEVKEVQKAFSPRDQIMEAFDVIHAAETFIRMWEVVYGESTIDEIRDSVEKKNRDRGYYYDGE